MLFQSSLRKDLSRSFGATLVVLATVVMTIMLIRTLGQASRGVVNPSDVMLVMGYTLLGHLPTLLALSLFVAVVGTLSRMYRDSEMVIWFASGKGLLGFVAPLFRFAWPVLLLIALLALVGWPWSNQQIAELKEKFEKRGDIERIAPGRFQESANGSRVFFIDKNSPNDRTGMNIFVAMSDVHKESVTLAHNARLESIGGDRFVLLNNGQRMEQSSQGEGIKISNFQEYGTLIEPNGFTPNEDNTTPAKTLHTLDLLREGSLAYQGELAWRVGLVLAGVNFLILALGLSMFNPRAGRSGSLLISLFAFVVYYNLLNLGKSWVSTGVVSMANLLLMLHGGTFILALLLLWKRHYNISFLHWLRWNTLKIRNRH